MPTKFNNNGVFVSTVAIILILVSACATIDTNGEVVERKRPFPMSFDYLSYIHDKNKGDIYSIYNSHLRRNHNLSGKIVFEFTIKPSGKVSNATVLSSELEVPELEQELLEFIKLINYGSGLGDDVTVMFPIDFLPD